jgi:hypothetical protein
VLNEPKPILHNDVSLVWNKPPIGCNIAFTPDKIVVMRLLGRRIIVHTKQIIIAR